MQEYRVWKGESVLLVERESVFLLDQEVKINNV